jgi:hypothetical protein
MIVGRVVYKRNETGVGMKAKFLWKLLKKKGRCASPNPNWLLKAHVPGLLAVSGIQTLMKLEWMWIKKKKKKKLLAVKKKKKKILAVKKMKKNNMLAAQIKNSKKKKKIAGWKKKKKSWILE